MASNYENVKLGPCIIVLDPGGTTPKTLETFKGGVQYNFQQEAQDVTLDKTGNTPVKKILSGVQASIVAPFAEYDLETIALLTPGSQIITNATTSKSKVVVKAKAGVDLLQYATKVRLEPIGGTVDDHITLVRAVAEPNVQYSYTVDGVRIFNVTFTGFPDPDADDTTVIYGDETVTAS